MRPKAVGGKGLSLPRKKISLKYGKSCLQHRAAQRLAGNPLSCHPPGTLSWKWASTVSFSPALCSATVSGLVCSSSPSSSPWAGCTSDSSSSMTCTTSMSVSWTPPLPQPTCLPIPHPRTLGAPSSQPCPALLWPILLRRPLHEVSPVLGAAGPVEGCPSLPSSPPSGCTQANSPQATANTHSGTWTLPSFLPQIPVPPLGTLDGLVPGIRAGHLSTGHICIPAIGGSRGLLA